MSAPENPPAWVFARVLTRAQKRAISTGYAYSLGVAQALTMPPLLLVDCFSTWPGLTGARIDKLTPLGAEVRSLLAEREAASLAQRSSGE